MGRKNKNARPPRVRLRPNTHLMYSTDELYIEPIIVRYMGEQEGEHIKCFNPEGFEFWAHISHVWIPQRSSQAA